MNNDLINELYSKIDNQEKIIVDLQKNNSGITLEEHVRVLNAYQELQEKYNKQKEVIDGLLQKINKAINFTVKETKSMPVNGCKIRLIKLLDILKGGNDE